MDDERITLGKVLMAIANDSSTSMYALKKERGGHILLPHSLKRI
jgi:hypothetical protein